jgi:hypothetical protein
MGGCGCKKKKTEAAVVTQTNTTNSTNAVNESQTTKQTDVFSAQVQVIVDKIKELNK